MKKRYFPSSDQQGEPASNHLTVTGTLFPVERSRMYIAVMSFSPGMVYASHLLSGESLMSYMFPSLLASTRLSDFEEMS